MDVDVVVDPAFDLGRYKVACDAEVDGHDRGVVEQHLFGAPERNFTRGRIALLVGQIDKRVEGGVGIAAIVEIGRRGLEQRQVVFRIAIVRDPAGPGGREVAFRRRL